jgi:multidrug efflux pump subunit AcrB
MWLVIASLRRPVTVLVAVVGLIVGASLAVARMPRDIFPDLELPVVYVTQTWPGMTPAQVEGLIVSKYEDTSSTSPALSTSNRVRCRA